MSLTVFRGQATFPQLHICSRYNATTATTTANSGSLSKTSGCSCTQGKGRSKENEEGKEEEEEEKRVLETFPVDPFNGVKAIPDKLPRTQKEFSVLLRNSLEKWRRDGRRGIWLQIPSGVAAELVPEALRQGFEFHHCKPQHIVLNKWLPRNELNKMPLDASSYVGVGGFVQNARDELLLVRERYVTGKMWKLPGGLANPGESIPQAVVREVYEETGVETAFESIIAVRHLPVARFDRGDLYFVCRLRLANAADGVDARIKIDPEEIAQARWMGIPEYVRHPKTPQLMKRIVEHSFRTKGAPFVKLPHRSGRDQFLYTFGDSGSVKAKDREEFLSLFPNAKL